MSEALYTIVAIFLFVNTVFLILVFEILSKYFNSSRFVDRKSYDKCEERVKELINENMKYQNGLINPSKSRLYFEAHITIEAEPDIEEFEEFKESVGPDWKVSRFDEDEVDGYDGKWFASSKHESNEVISHMLESALFRLQKDEFIVIRAKIENTQFDTKYGDSLGSIQIPFPERV